MGGQHDRRTVAARTRAKQAAADVPASPAFRRVRRGCDPLEVAHHLEELEQERRRLQAALAESENVRGDQRDRLDRFEAIESELTRSVRLARQTGDAVLADARRRAEELLADARREVEAMQVAGRALLAEEERSLDNLRMAVAAEATMLKEIERHLSTHLSRAAASLVEIVDRPGGLGPFSQATATLIEFAQLLQRTATPGTPVRVQVDLAGDEAVARVMAAGAKATVSGHVTQGTGGALATAG
jgi:DNA repair exonuclease SbcCD ATPase subunit